MIDTLGDRMKAYEGAGSTEFTRRLPVAVRVDGRAFHTFVKRAGFEKPFDTTMKCAMRETAAALAREMSNAVFAFTQSDEISIIMVDDRELTTEPWFGNKLQKIVSMAASIATAKFNDYLLSSMVDVTGVRDAQDLPPTALFDARAFTLPHAEVTNYLLWRQRDGSRNCALSIAQHRFGHKRIQGVSTSELIKMIPDWDDRSRIPLWQRNGIAVRRFVGADGGIIQEVDEAPPNFGEDRIYVEECLSHTPTITRATVPTVTLTHDKMKGNE